MNETPPAHIPVLRPWRAECAATLTLAWPLIITNLGQTAMTATDVVMMGRLGPEAVAAGALGTNLYFALLIFGIGVMSATSPLIAAIRGHRPHEIKNVRRTVRQGLWAALTISLVSWAVLWNGERICLFLRQDPTLSAMAGSYLRTLQWSVLPFLAYLVLRSFLAGLERPGWSLLAVAIGFLFNIVGNWALMFGHLGLPALGLPGSGLATTLSSTLMFGVLVGVVLLDRRFRRYRLFGRWWRIEQTGFFAFWKLGLPIGATLAFEVTIFNAAVFLMGLLGPNSLAAHAIAIQIASLTFMVPLGFGQAVSVRVGLGYGARDASAITRAGWVAFTLGVGFMALTAFAMLAVPHLLIGAFLDIASPRNAAVVDLAVGFLAVAALFQIVDGAQAVGAGMLRGLHDTRVPMLYAAFGYWGLGLPLAALLGFATPLAGIGIWLGLAFGLAIVSILMVYRWMSRERLGLVGHEQSMGNRQ